MLKYFRSIVFIFLIIFACRHDQYANLQPIDIQVAFMADVHLQDIYGEFQDIDYEGVFNPGNSKYVLARTMQAQIKSTRIFNENYFAFLAALDDVVKRNVKFVVFPGDFSDDGQPLNIRGLKKIINHYSETYGIRFIATTGNHDPVRPFSQDAGKSDFMGIGGKSQAIMSKEGMYVPKTPEELPVVITQDIRTMGYEEILSTLDELGFFPQKEDLYWETPFTDYDIDSYNFQNASRQSQLENRNYEIKPFNTKMPDASYLVEPIKDVWFLAIDANVYVPNENAKIQPKNPASFGNASIGYNNVLTHKKHLIKWVEKVTREAEKRGKILLAFSHYPMIDFNDDATPNLNTFLAGKKMQVHRVPKENVAQTFADAGIRLHFGGHIHINDTGVRQSSKGNTLVNVQIPSIAAYIPAYKLLTIHNQKMMEVETIILDSVPHFNELFPIYEQEYAYLKSINAKNIWDKSILSSKSYHEFTNKHLKELVRFRFLQSDWPITFSNFFLNASGKELFLYAAKAGSKMPNEINNFESWTGFDMIFDFYRLRSADKLAIKDIGPKRIEQYEVILDAFLHVDKTQTFTKSKMHNDLREFSSSFRRFLNGMPANNFVINLKTGEVFSEN